MMHWMPLESNPEALNKFIGNLGVSDNVQFCDVYGLDPELLCMVPQPCYAVILLFPISDKYLEFCVQEAQEVEKNGQVLSNDVFYMKQTIGNACGTIGVIHALANCKKHLKFLPDSAFETFLKDTANLSPEKIGEKLENNAAFQTAHTACAHEGQSETVAADAKVNLHFVAFVQVDGCLYELDGRKTSPINHGPSNKDTFLFDAAASCQKFMQRNPEELQFSVIALSDFSDC